MRTFNNVLSPMNTPREGCAAAAHDGKIYVTGGPPRYRTTTEVYNIATKQWSFIEPMSTARFEAAAVSFNGNIVIMGGYDRVKCRMLSSAEQYSPITNEWTPFPSMNIPRTSCAAAVVDGKIIVVGGFNKSDRYLASAEEYDPNTESWSELPSMNFTRQGCAAAVLDGQLYVMGGSDGRKSLSSVEVYNSETKQWTLINDMITSRYGCAAVVMGGRIIVIGGYNYIGGGGRIVVFGGYTYNRGRNYLSSCESYDPETQKWSHIASMHNKRSNCAAVEVGGTIFVVGGHDGRKLLPTMECLPYFACLLDDKPEIAKEFGINDTTMPTFLSFVNQNCKMLTLWKVIRNRPDLLTI